MFILTLWSCADALVVGDGKRGAPDSGGEDTAREAPVAPVAGEYAGTLTAQVTVNGRVGSCEGEATLTVAADASFSGTAGCTSDLIDPLEGPLSGNAVGGDVSGTWAVVYADTEFTQLLAGSTTASSIELSSQFEGEEVRVISTMLLNKL